MNDNPSPSSVSSAPQATTREFLTVAFRRKWIIVGLFLVTTLTVMVVTLATPIAYISSGRVLFKRGEQLSVLEPDPRIFSDWEQDLGSELQMLRSVPVLDRARQSLRQAAGRGQRSLELQAANVDVEVMGKSNVIAIGYRDRDPLVARAVCDALIRAYIDYREDQMGSARPAGFFADEIARTESEMDRLAESRRRFFLDRGLADVPEQTRALVSQLTALQQQRVTTEADLAEAQALERVMRALQQRPDVDMPIPNIPSGMDVLQNLKQKVLDQEARVAQLRERYRDESPEVTNALETLAVLRGMLKREVETRLEVQSSRTEILRSRLVSLEHEESRLRSQLETMPTSEAHIAALDGEIVMLKDRHRGLIQQRDQARVNEIVAARARVILLAPAGAAVPTNAHDYVRLALAPAFSLVVGIGLAFFIDGLDITVRTASHAEEAISVPVLAALSERRRRRLQPH